MPDITMCTGVGCPLKETCYRYKAKPDEWWQSFFKTPPFEKGKCEHYWEIKRGKNNEKRN